MTNPVVQKRLLRALWLTAILTVMTGSLLPAASGPMELLGSLGISDKVEHCLAYLTLAFLPAIHERWRFVVMAALACVLLGIALEYGQLLSPGRDFEVADMLADALGVSLGLGLGFALRSTRVVRAWTGRKPSKAYAPAVIDE